MVRAKIKVLFLCFIQDVSVVLHLILVSVVNIDDCYKKTMRCNYGPVNDTHGSRVSIDIALLIHTLIVRMLPMKVTRWLGTPKAASLIQKIRRLNTLKALLKSRMQIPMSSASFLAFEIALCTLNRLERHD